MIREIKFDKHWAGLSFISSLLGRMGGVLLEIIARTRCVVCESPGALLCDRCATHLVSVDNKMACPHCAAPFGGIVCTECQRPDGLRLFSFDAARACFVFDETSARIVKAFKDEGERRLANLIALNLVEAAAEWILSADFVVPLPATQAALRTRDFDHMALVAEKFSGITGVSLLDCLTKVDTRDQRGLTRTQRQENMEESFSLGLPGYAALIKIRAPRVILIDDVFTTGATLDAAATALRHAGAQSIYAVVLCRVW
jgi:ComF family protein